MRTTPKIRTQDDVSVQIGDHSNQRFEDLRSSIQITESNTIHLYFRNLKYSDDTTSRDSDSLIQEYGNSTINEPYTYCWHHPKVKENWRTVLAAVVLLVVGIALLTMGAYSVSIQNGSQATVFFVAGFICFVPGAYHVVYVWLAARGYRGFDFYHLPLFT